MAELAHPHTEGPSEMDVAECYEIDMPPWDLYEDAGESSAVDGPSQMDLADYAEIGVPPPSEPMPRPKPLPVIYAEPRFPVPVVRVPHARSRERRSTRRATARAGPDDPSDPDPPQGRHQSDITLGRRAA